MDLGCSAGFIRSSSRNVVPNRYLVDRPGRATWPDTQKSLGPVESLEPSSANADASVGDDGRAH